MALEVKLEAFEGPLDLLLHLIEKKKIDIYDIPIVEITEQYLDCIRQMPDLDLNGMSEFLVMAATLLDIKCRMLLPQQTEEEEAQEDPRAELVQKLLEYKMYKYISYELKDLQTNAGISYFREMDMPEEVAAYREPVDYEQLIGDATLSRLHEIFTGVMRRQADKVDPVRSSFGRIEKDEINLEEKSGYVESFLRTHSRFPFRKLLEKQHSKMEIIVTFLVVLELMKVGRITVEQQSIDDEIIVISKEEN